MPSSHPGSNLLCTVARFKAGAKRRPDKLPAADVRPPTAGTSWLVGALACALCVLLLSSCLWRGYSTIAAVHVDVLTQMATKLCSIVESGRRLKAEDMAEYTYPAQRAREFLRQFASYHTRHSYQQFTALLDRYEALVRQVDAARALPNGYAQLDGTRLDAERRALQQLAADVRTDLSAGN